MKKRKFNTVSSQLFSLLLYRFYCFTFFKLRTRIRYCNHQLFMPKNKEATFFTPSINSLFSYLSFYLVKCFNFSNFVSISLTVFESFDHFQQRSKRHSRQFFSIFKWEMVACYSYQLTTGTMTSLKETLL